MMVDLSTLSDAALARYGRACIASACARIVSELDRDPDVPMHARFDIGLSLERGIVMFRDRETHAVYALADGEGVRLLEATQPA
jgi:hypothetical protein